MPSEQRRSGLSREESGETARIRISRILAADIWVSEGCVPE